MEREIIRKSEGLEALKWLERIERRNTLIYPQTDFPSIKEIEAKVSGILRSFDLDGTEITTALSERIESARKNAHHFSAHGRTNQLSCPAEKHRYRTREEICAIADDIREQFKLGGQDPDNDTVLNKKILGACSNACFVGAAVHMEYLMTTTEVRLCTDILHAKSAIISLLDAKDAFERKLEHPAKTPLEAQRQLIQIEAAVRNAGYVGASISLALLKDKNPAHPCSEYIINKTGEQCRELHKIGDIPLTEERIEEISAAVSSAQLVSAGRYLSRLERKEGVYSSTDLCELVGAIRNQFIAGGMEVTGVGALRDPDVEERLTNLTERPTPKNAL